MSVRHKSKHRFGTSSNRNNSYKIGMVCLGIIILCIIGVVLFFILRKPGEDPVPSVHTTESGESSSETPSSSYDDVLSVASVYAAQYDYDRAITYVKTNAPNYEEDETLSIFISECEAKKLKLIKWSDNSKITHVFFHTLIADTDLAFKSSQASDYNEVMTTIDEFNAIMESMYQKGFVLVHIKDIAKISTGADGTKKMAYTPIYLPAGKTPFVLSVDDVSYYEYMSGDGYANRLVIDENNRVVNEMDLPTGTVRGSFDVVPLLDEFVEKHPDFSYRGAKGTIALTGYNGILGYRTSYITYGDASIYQKYYNDLFVSPNFDEAHAVELAHGAHLYDNPNIEEDRKKAAAVAARMMETGWDFASHTWGHMDMSTVVSNGIPNERFYRDTQWWMVEVAPLLKGTDQIIFAFGADIGSWRNYSDANEAFLYLKSLGFDYYCNVDSSKTSWVQMSSDAGGSGYLRQGRRNLDGQLMFKQLVNKDKNILYDLFDPKEVFDRSRPLPVPGVTLPEGYNPKTLFTE